MDIQERVSAFMSRAASQAEALTVQARSSKVQNADRNQNFIKALKVGLPALMLVSAAHANVDRPAQIDLRFDDKPIVTASYKADSPAALKLELLRTTQHPMFNQYMKCMTELINDIEASTVNKLYAMHIAFNHAPSAMSEIHQYAQEKNMKPEVVLAAVCLDAENWKDTVDRWAKKSESVNEKARQGAESYEQKQARAIIRTHLAQAESHLGAAQYAFHHTEGPSLDHSLLHKTSGDWMSAVLSVASGIAEVAGTKEMQKDVRNARRLSNRSKSIGNRIQSAKRQSGARKWERYGSIIGDVGREINRMTATPGVRR